MDVINLEFSDWEALSFDTLFWGFVQHNVASLQGTYLKLESRSYVDRAERIVTFEAGCLREQLTVLAESVRRNSVP